MILISKEFIVSILTSGLLIWGYTYNAEKQRDLEVFKIKTGVYSDYINALDDVENLASAVSRLYMYAPDCVIKKVNAKYKYIGNIPYSDLDVIRAIKHILHDDIYGIVVCKDKITLEDTDFISLAGTIRISPKK